MKKVWLLFLVLFFASLGVMAQAGKEYSSFWPGIGVQLGSPGFGIEGSYPLSDDFNVRFGVNTFPSIRPGVRNRGFQLHRSNVLFAADWQPLFGKRSWIACKWSVSGGIAYFLSNTLERYNPTAESDDRTKIYEVTWSKFRPYLGAGLNNIRLDYHINLSLNAGFFLPTSKSKLRMEKGHEDMFEHLQSQYQSIPGFMVSSFNMQVGIFYIFF